MNFTAKSRCHFVLLRYKLYTDSLNLRHPDQYVSRSRHDDGTSNLKRHVERCASVDDAEASGQLTMQLFASGSTYSEPQLRLLLVEWCACNNRPMIIVDDEPFQKMLRMLHANVAIPSRQTLSRDIKAVFKIAQAHGTDAICQG